MDNTLQPDFVIGNMADDLVSLTLSLCNKTDDGTPRFPKLLYSTYVQRIIDTSLDIQSLVFEANSNESSGDNRKKLQIKSMGKCVYLNHLIRIAYDNKWISNKQLNRWQGLCTNLYWKIYHWNKA